MDWVTHPSLVGTGIVSGGTADGDEQQRFEMFVAFLDGVAAEGPADLSTQVSSIVERYRPLVDLGISYLREDENFMTASALDDVIAEIMSSRLD